MEEDRVGVFKAENSLHVFGVCKHCVVVATLGEKEDKTMEVPYIFLSVVLGTSLLGNDTNFTIKIHQIRISY